MQIRNLTSERERLYSRLGPEIVDFWCVCVGVDVILSKLSSESDVTLMRRLRRSCFSNQPSPQLSELLVTTENTLNPCDTLPPVTYHALARFSTFGAQWDGAVKWEGLVTLSGDV